GARGGPPDAQGAGGRNSPSAASGLGCGPRSDYPESGSLLPVAELAVGELRRLRPALAAAARRAVRDSGPAGDAAASGGAGGESRRLPARSRGEDDGGAGARHRAARAARPHRRLRTDAFCLGLRYPDAGALWFQPARLVGAAGQPLPLPALRRSALRSLYAARVPVRRYALPDTVHAGVRRGAGRGTAAADRRNGTPDL